MQSKQNAVEATGLTKTYSKKITLNDFSITIPEGSIFGLLGPNGAGKSTFIRILAGIERQESGEIKIFGKKADKEERKKIGVAPQENAFYPFLTCMENLLYFDSLYEIDSKRNKDKADALLSALGLDDKKNAIARFLSGGMKRRLNLACALMHDPKIIVLDEPTTGLDPIVRRQLWGAVRKIASETNATIILTTHYMEEAEELCDRIAFVNRGRVVAVGTPEELKKKTKKREMHARGHTLEDVFLQLTGMELKEEIGR